MISISLVILHQTTSDGVLVTALLVILWEIHKIMSLLFSQHLLGLHDCRVLGALVPQARLVPLSLAPFYTYRG